MTHPDRVITPPTMAKGIVSADPVKGSVPLLIRPHIWLVIPSYTILRAADGLI